MFQENNLELPYIWLSREDTFPIPMNKPSGNELSTTSKSLKLVAHPLLVLSQREILDCPHETAHLSC